jgi:hypothetical protein
MPADRCPGGCGRPRPIDMVMCRACWAKVPASLQRAVYRAWDARLKHPGDRAKVAAHEAAKAAAIKAATR